VQSAVLKGILQPAVIWCMQLWLPLLQCQLFFLFCLILRDILCNLVEIRSLLLRENIVGIVLDLFELFESVTGVQFIKYGVVVV